MCCWCSWYWPTLFGLLMTCPTFGRTFRSIVSQTRRGERERERDRHCVKLAAINLHTDSEYNKGWYNYGPDRKLKIFHLPWWWPWSDNKQGQMPNRCGRLYRNQLQLESSYVWSSESILKLSIVSITFGS